MYLSEALVSPSPLLITCLSAPVTYDYQLAYGRIVQLIDGGGHFD